MIKAIEIDISGRSMTLTLEQARYLHECLFDLFNPPKPDNMDEEMEAIINSEVVVKIVRDKGDKISKEQLNELLECEG
jgi:hypothetical protein